MAVFLSSYKFNVDIFTYPCSVEIDEIVPFVPSIDGFDVTLFYDLLMVSYVSFLRSIDGRQLPVTFIVLRAFERQSTLLNDPQIL